MTPEKCPTPEKFGENVSEIYKDLDKVDGANSPSLHSLLPNTKAPKVDRFKSDRDKAKGSGVFKSYYCQLAVPIFLVLTHTACTVVGVVALSRDWSVTDTPCGKASHIVKHCFLNLVLIAVTFLSYFLFPGGGEGARARAIALMMCSTAFLVWGILLMSDLRDGCGGVFTSHYPTMFLCVKMGVVYNSLLATSLLLHETWLGTRAGYDLTLMPSGLCGSEGIWRPEDHTTSQPIQDPANSIFGEAQEASPGNRLGNHTAVLAIPSSNEQPWLDSGYHVGPQGIA